MDDNNRYWTDLISRGISFLQEQNNDAAAAVLKKATFDVEHRYHDSWGWGKDYWELVLLLRHEDFVALGDRKEQCERDIMTALVSFQKESRDILATVTIRPLAEQAAECEAALPFQKTEEGAEIFIREVSSIPLNWAVLGTGVIANEMAAGLQKMGKTLYSVANRTHSKAVDFAGKYGIRKVYDSMDDIFVDDAVDIIYITTPHNTHYEFMKKALQNGKHVLAEKSVTLNSDELEELIGLARQKGLVIAEAMTIWHMPLYKDLWRIVESGELGRVQMITVNFGSFKEYNMNNRFFSKSLAGGAMLDIGVYALSIVRSFMEEMPASVMSQWKPAPTGVDEQATILLQNEKGQMATVALSMHSKQPKRAMISCEKGYIEIMEFPRADRAVIVDAATGERREIAAGRAEDALCYELSDMEKAVISGDPAEMKLQYTADVMKIMTSLRKSWGMTYPEEE